MQRNRDWLGHLIFLQIKSLRKHYRINRNNQALFAAKVKLTSQG
jgi:hypothetical protein